MKGLRLYKKEKLCSTTAIESLFARGADVNSALVYPLRAVWRQNPRRHSDAPMAFLISVPKRRLHHAVDRVQIRRRIREAYRLSRLNVELPDDARLDLAFVYVADRLLPYSAIESAMARLLKSISSTQCNPV